MLSGIQTEPSQFLNRAFARLAAALSLAPLSHARCIDGMGGSWQLLQPAQQFKSDSRGWHSSVG